MDVMIPEGDHQGGHHHGGDLSGDSGNSRAGHTHGRESQQPKDHDGVQDDVGDGADELEDHGPDHVAGGLEGLLQGDLYKYAEGEHTADGDVRAAHPDDFLVCFEELKEGGGEKSSIQGEQHPGADCQYNAMSGGGIGFILTALAQAAGDQAGDAHSGTHCKGDEQVLQGERQTDCGQSLLADLGHKIAVHDIVQRLHQHGEHGWQGHREDQGQHGGGTHFVLLDFLSLHTTHPISFFTFRTIITNFAEDEKTAGLEKGSICKQTVAFLALGWVDVL